MDFANLMPGWLDAIFIAPFRWPANPLLGMWLGSAFLASYAVLVGEAVGAVLFFLHQRYYNTLQDDVVRYHNISVQALHSGNKDAYLAANTVAQEHFGKSFFAQASIGMSTLLPLPFVLAWMALRFEGITLHIIPVFNRPVGYVFILLTLYLVMRIMFSRLKKRLPLFRRIERIKQLAREARGPARSFFSPSSSHETKTTDKP